MNTLTRINTISLAVALLLLTTACEKQEEKHYDLLPAQEEPAMDITRYGILSVKYENNGGVTHAEGSPKVVDNDNDTKYLVQSFAPDFYMQLSFPSGINVNAYELVSGNDAPDRDPQDWELVGSNDEENWTVLDQVSGFSFTGRKQVARFDYDNTEAFRFYRLNITAKAGGTSGIFQLAEWRIFHTPPTASHD